LASLTTDAAGSTAINTTAITTTGAQTYNDAAIIGSNATLVTTANGNITFRSTLDDSAAGTHALTINAFALSSTDYPTVFLADAVGDVNRLRSLTIYTGLSPQPQSPNDYVGLIHFGRTVKTTGDQRYTTNNFSLTSNIALGFITTNGFVYFDWGWKGTGFFKNSAPVQFNLDTVSIFTLYLMNYQGIPYVGATNPENYINSNIPYFLTAPVTVELGEAPLIGIVEVGNTPGGLNDTCRIIVQGGCLQ
jgi:hypothetical protein